MSNLTEGRKVTPRWYRDWDKRELELHAGINMILKVCAGLIIPILIMLTLILGGCGPSKHELLTDTDCYQYCIAEGNSPEYCEESLMKGVYP